MGLPHLERREWVDSISRMNEEINQAELEVLANFNAFCEERVDRLPTNQGVRGLQSSPEWQQIQERAKELLTSLDWDASSKASIPGGDVDKSNET